MFKTDRQGQVILPPEPKSASPPFLLARLLSRIAPYFPDQEVGSNSFWEQEIKVDSKVLSQPRRLKVSYRLQAFVPREGRDVARLQMQCSFPIAFAPRKYPYTPVVMGGVEVDGDYLFDHQRSIFLSKNVKLRIELTFEEEALVPEGFAQTTHTLQEESQITSTLIEVVSEPSPRP